LAKKSKNRPENYGNSTKGDSIMFNLLKLRCILFDKHVWKRIRNGIKCILCGKTLTIATKATRIQ
jgi:hypothetical protein